MSCEDKSEALPDVPRQKKRDRPKSEFITIEQQKKLAKTMTETQLQELCDLYFEPQKPGTDFTPAQADSNATGIVLSPLPVEDATRSRVWKHVDQIIARTVFLDVDPIMLSTSLLYQAYPGLLRLYWREQELHRALFVTPQGFQKALAKQVIHLNGVPIMMMPFKEPTPTGKGNKTQKFGRVPSNDDTDGAVQDDPKIESGEAGAVTPELSSGDQPSAAANQNPTAKSGKLQNELPPKDSRMGAFAADPIELAAALLRSRMPGLRKLTWCSRSARGRHWLAVVSGRDRFSYYGKSDPTIYFGVVAIFGTPEEAQKVAAVRFYNFHGTDVQAYYYNAVFAGCPVDFGLSGPQTVAQYAHV